MKKSDLLEIIKDFDNDLNIYYYNDNNAVEIEDIYISRIKEQYGYLMENKDGKQVILIK